MYFIGDDLSRYEPKEWEMDGLSPAYGLNYLHTSMTSFPRLPSPVNRNTSQSPMSSALEPIEPAGPTSPADL